MIDANELFISLRIRYFVPECVSGALKATQGLIAGKGDNKVADADILSMVGSSRHKEAAMRATGLFSNLPFCT